MNVLRIPPFFSRKEYLKLVSDLTFQVDGLVQDAVKRGARLVLGGKKLGGTMYSPTLLCDVTREMEIAQQEIFGPLAAVRK